MSVIALDIGGTKISGGLFSGDGIMLARAKRMIGTRTGNETARLALSLFMHLHRKASSIGEDVTAAGICVPGIVRHRSGTVWAPNIPGWDNYPLKEFFRKSRVGKDIPFYIESDRTCHILGETWKGAARGCTDAIVIAVGTGIGAGIMSGGMIIGGHGDIAGAAGWMALEQPFLPGFEPCGCFEYYASGNGIAARAREILLEHTRAGRPYNFPGRGDEMTTDDVFRLYQEGNPLAVKVISKAIAMWGMAAANLISLLNPQVVVWGGGVFGPARAFLDEIYREAVRWSQPVAIQQVSFTASGLGEHAALFGAARRALHETDRDTFFSEIPSIINSPNR